MSPCMYLFFLAAYIVYMIVCIHIYRFILLNMMPQHALLLKCQLLYNCFKKKFDSFNFYFNEFYIDWMYRDRVIVHLFVNLSVPPILNMRLLW